MTLLGVEAGGTKFVVGAAHDPSEILERVTIPTEHPSVTIPSVVKVLGEFADRHGPAEAIGVASFGPIEVRREHPRWGWITTTPKHEWVDTDLVGPIRSRFPVPAGFDTDVNGAALAEGGHGAGRGVSSLVYITVGTGIGGGLLVAGSTRIGAGHPEMGHITVPRHPDDDFPGLCPHHDDCLEALASGPAIEARWGRSASDLGGDLDTALEFESFYLAHALASIVFVASPTRFILGGGVSKLPGFHEAIRKRLSGLLLDYPGLDVHQEDGYVVPPGLGDDAGLIGALMLAQQARD